LLGAVTTLAELGKHDAVLASVTEPELDYTTPSGRAFMQQMFVFAESVRGTLKESWATAQRHAIERGVHISPTVPLGYDRGEDGRVTPNAQAPVATEMFRRRGGGVRAGARSPAG
jgi:DNA invertase Pin-like site-specific DNA recombinase